MKIEVDQALCKGCGSCVSVCPTGAIRLLNGKAMIDSSNCSFCEACVEICPTGALQLVSKSPLVSPAKPTAIEIVEPESLPAPSYRRSTWNGLVLSFVGQYLLPRLVDVLATTLEHRLSPTTPSQTPRSFPVSASYPRRRRRQRYGRMQSKPFRRGDENA